MTSASFLARSQVYEEPELRLYAHAYRFAMDGAEAVAVSPGRPAWLAEMDLDPWLRQLWSGQAE